jgi:hypothetical protein
MRLLWTVAVMVLLSGGAALACRCPIPSLASVAPKADGVFAGEIVRVTETARTVSLTVAVKEVWRGQPTAETVVHTINSSCGVHYAGAKLGRTFLFVADQREGGWGTRQCTGSRTMSKGARKQLERLFGPAKAP